MEDAKMFWGSVFYELGMACETVEERAELWQAIMEYGLFDKEPPEKFKRDFVNIKFILSKSKKIAYLRGKAGEQHTGNQYTQGDEKRKPNEEAQKKAVEQNGTNGTSWNKMEQMERNNSLSLSNNDSISSNSKKKYLEYIYLSDKEYKKLIEGYGERVVKDMIEKVNDWIGEKPKEKKRQKDSHYHTILNWLRRDGVKKLPEKPKDDSGVYENLRDQDVYLQELIKGKQK